MPINVEIDHIRCTGAAVQGERGGRGNRGGNSDCTHGRGSTFDGHRRGIDIQHTAFYIGPELWHIRAREVESMQPSHRAQALFGRQLLDTGP